MTSSKQDSDFTSAVINSSLLEEAIDWISSNLDPSDVFSESDLEDWAHGHGWKEDED